LTAIFTAETTMPDVETTRDTDIEFVVMGEEELEKPFRVIIHNDDVTPFDFVIAVLCTIFELTSRRATQITYEAHTTGNALVTVLPYEEAHRRVYNAQSAAREFGYPLSFTIEPDQ
jgi:ATP-dependent Clp protease adaptor protein ClpS